MQRNIIIVPSSQLVMVNGEPLKIIFEPEGEITAIHWDGKQGRAEYANGLYAETFGEREYEDLVAPLAALWDAEKARLTAEAARHPDREEALTAIRERRKQAEYGGFLFDGQRWDCELKDEQRLNSVITMMEKLGLPEFQGWKIAEDVFITLTPELALAAATAMMRHYSECFIVEETKRGLLLREAPEDGAATQQWLNDNLEEGWPGTE